MQAPDGSFIIGTSGDIWFGAVGTTAESGNAYLSGSNNLLRSTSSLKYKTDVETLDSVHADAVLTLRPIWYRSKADADNPAWSWYGLAAEEVAAVDPRLVHWSGLEPDGVQYERVAVLLLDVVRRLQERVASLETFVASYRHDLEQHEQGRV